MHRRGTAHVAHGTTPKARRARPGRARLSIGDLPPDDRDAAGWAAAARAVSSARGDSVFEDLVRALAGILDVELAFIARYQPDEDPCAMRMLALSFDGRIQRDLRYEVRGTPCETVLGQQFRAYPQRLRELFPLDTDFARQGIESYAGHPMTDLEGRPLGTVSVASRRPLARVERLQAMLQIFAVRAAAEIERLRADEALRRSEASYRAIFEAAEDAIFLHDWDSGAVMDVNTKACETYGYSREELRGISVDAISSGVPPYTAEGAMRHLERAKAGDCPPVEWHRRNKDGSLHWDEVRLKPVTIDGRRYILAFTREITARKQAVEALQRSEARLRATVEAAFDCVIGMDGEGRIVEFNGAAERCFGRRRADAMGRPLGELIIPERLRAAHARGLQRFLREGRGPFVGRLVETTALRADGSEFPVELAISVAPVPEGSIFVGHLRDISARREAEAQRAELETQLRQAQKMEAIGQLTGGIAHDFNNILTSVVGYLVLGQERAETLQDATLQRQLGQAQLAAQRARELIAQMLTFARRQRGERRALALGPLVAQAVTLLRASMPSTLRIEVDEGGGRAGVAPLPAVEADAVQVEQVLFNLCINARDAMDGIGLVRVGLAEVDTGRGERHCASCRAPVGGRWVELSVADEGCGIPPEVRERMFDPFYSTKEAGRGSGMGLAMVHGIVHDHGGHVLVDGGPGRGTVFRVLLPASRGAAGEAPPQDRTRPPAARTLHGRVLVVEDQALVGDFLAELLGGWGLEVELQRDPLEAAARLSGPRPPPDLLLTDQTMPHLTGLQLAERARALHPGLPVLLVTGDAAELGAAPLRRAGVQVVLRKPLAPEALRAALQRLLEDRGAT